MKKLIGIVAVLIIVILGCKKSDIPEFEIIEFTKVVGNCDSSSCVDIHLKYHLMKKEYPAAKVFNPLMENAIYSKMSYVDEKSKSKDEIVERVIKDYKAFMLEFPESATGGYIQTSETSISYKSSQVISIFIKSDIYSGGAHGSHSKEFLNINPQTGKEIDMCDLIKPMDTFLSLVENKLRSKLEMGPNDKWEDFTFIDEFKLPNNMGMTANGLLLIYNEYEILSYADGTTEILIPNNELSSFLNLDH